MVCYVHYNICFIPIKCLLLEGGQLWLYKTTQEINESKIINTFYLYYGFICLQIFSFFIKLNILCFWFLNYGHKV